MRTLDSAAVARRGLSAFCYQIVVPAGGTGAGVRAFRGARAPRRVGLPGAAGLEALRGHRRSIAFCEEWREARHGLKFETDGVVIKLDELALRERARHDGEVPTMGDGIQVSSGTGENAPPAHRRQRRPHGRRDAVCRARACPAQRNDRADGHAAQRTGSRAARHPRRRHRDRREGRRHHSEGRSDPCWPSGLPTSRVGRCRAPVLSARATW